MERRLAAGEEIDLNTVSTQRRFAPICRALSTLLPFLVWAAQPTSLLEFILETSPTIPASVHELLLTRHIFRVQVSASTNAAAKAAMDRNFDSNRLRPGDRGFNYDVRVDFPEEKDDNDWDDRHAPIALACACSCALFEKLSWLAPARYLRRSRSKCWLATV